MKMRSRWLAIAAIGLLISGCSKSTPSRIRFESYLQLLLNNPNFGVDVFVKDFPSAMKVDEVRQVKSLEDSGYHDDARAQLLSMIKAAALSHTNASAYLSAGRDAESQCESNQGDGYWQGTLGVSLHAFCDGTANLAALVQERTDHPAEF